MFSFLLLFFSFFFFSSSLSSQKKAYDWSGFDPLKFFALVDNDHNGLISPAEFAQVMKKVTGSFRQHTTEVTMEKFHGMGETHISKILTTDEVSFLFRLIDTDKSGYISVKEFSEFLKEMDRGSNEGQWTNALEKAMQQDLIENERRRRMFIEKKELLGRKRRLLKSKDAVAQEAAAQKAGGNSPEDIMSRARTARIHRSHIEESQPPSLGSIVHFNSSVKIHQHIPGMEREVEREIKRKNKRRESGVWSQSMQDVPVHFKKVPGEEKAILRRRAAEAKRRSEEKQTGHRTYEPNTKWRPTQHRHKKVDGSIVVGGGGGVGVGVGVVSGTRSGVIQWSVAPKVHGMSDEKYEQKVAEGRKRRELAERRMAERLGKRPMYHGGDSDRNAKVEEEAAVVNRTRQSVPANDRIQFQRDQRLLERAKQLSLASSATSIGSLRRGSLFSSSNSAANSRGPSLEQKLIIEDVDEAIEGRSDDVISHPSSHVSELERIAAADEMEGGEYYQAAEQQQQQQQQQQQKLLVTPSEPRRQHGRKMTSYTSSATAALQSTSAASIVPTTASQSRSTPKIKSSARKHQRKTSMTAFGSTVKISPPSSSSSSPTVAASPPTASRSPTTTSPRNSSSSSSPSTSRRRGSYFGMTTHQHTQRRKAMNRKKLHGEANEHGVSIRKAKHFGGQGVHLSREARRHAKRVQKSKEPKRVVERPAFGSASPKTGLQLGFRNGDRHAEERSPDMKKNNGTEESVAVAGKSARRGGRRRAGGLGKHKLERKEGGGAHHSKEIKSPRSPPNLQRTSSKQIQSGWSPGVIRGTSVTAHTHTSSSTVLAHTHRTLSGMSNASEEDLRS